MADAQEPQAAPAGQEPSMEEILASIRKIIADEPAAAAANGAPAANDVLELTQMVQEDGSVVDLKAPEPPKETRMAPPPPPPPPQPPSPPVVEKKPEAPPSLISEPAAAASASALSSLASTVEIERLSAVPASATFLGNGAKTIEEMVVELMKPLLKDWLDKNLPAAVDRLVQKEIERIARKAQPD
jgi:cell pole-organizing protein PopZ